AKYALRSNPRTERAYAALYTTLRPQAVIPHAVDVPASSQVEIRRANGSVETYKLTWTKSGVPLQANGPVTSPVENRLRTHVLSSDPFTNPTETGDAAPAPVYSMIGASRATAGIGALRPVFSLPANFKVRLGQLGVEPFYTGTYQSGGYTIGF